MNNLIVRFGLVATSVLLAMAMTAGAWGSRSQRGVAMSSIQMIRQTYPEAFKASKSNYDMDVVAGAEKGLEELRAELAIHSTSSAINAVSHQIQVLRDVRQYGMGSHFAYRMGALSALVADIVLPLALDESEENRAVKQRMEADIDDHFASYSIFGARRTPRIVRAADQYFESLKEFHASHEIMILDDYRRGNGYEGFLKRGGEAYFIQTVEAVSDVWNTILAPEGSEISTPSPQVVAWYLVDEIQFLLKEKNNFYQAEQVYKNFEKVNPRLREPYEVIGDYFYAFATEEAIARGVSEWKIAQRYPGPQRARAAGKLTSHYINLGQERLFESQQSGASIAILDEAIQAFSDALEYDKTSEESARYLNEATLEKQKKLARQDQERSYLTRADEIMQSGGVELENQAFEAALSEFSMAVVTFGLVTEEFADLSDQAKNGLKDARKKIKQTFVEALEKARATIQQGDTALEENKFPEAEAHYRLVAEILSFIPEDEDTAQSSEKLDLLEQASDQITAVKDARARFEAQLNAGGAS